MSCEGWKTVKLRDVCSTNKYSYCAKDNWKFVNYLDTGSITENRIEKIVRIDFKNQKLPSRARRKVKIGDIIYSTVRPNQKHYGYISRLYDNFLVSTGFATLHTNKKIANSRFIFYFLTQSYLTKALHAIGEQSTSAYPSIKPSDIQNIVISLPPLPEQKAIASVLSALDDKIELNNKINKNLEEMAQAIYKSWFVDFEPFKDGEFIDSELGRIPKGWRVGTFSDLGKIIGGSTPSKKRKEYYTDKGIAWITPKDLSINKNKYISNGAIDITELGLKNSSTKLMPEGTVLFSSRAPIGYIAIAKNTVTTNQGFKSIVPRKNVGTPYVYCSLKKNLSQIENMASGSTFKEVSGTIMKQVLALIPDDSVLSDFTVTISALFELQQILEKENAHLAQLRDTLLPKLMSGEIRVPVEVE